MRPRAGVDLDGVVVNWELQARTMLGEWFGIKLDVSDSYDAIQNAVTAVQWRWLWTTGVRTGLFRLALPYYDALNELPRIAETHDVVVITKRPRSVIQDTLAWLVEHKIPASEVVMLHPDSGPREKSSVPCDWYVDDCSDVADELARAGRRVFLMDRPWNRTPSEPSVRRVKGWRQITEAML